ncbi:MAG TPA: OmpA family protein [Gemmatimonadaceae bacterium]|nr:OmpA family protein [Gemmatimonadaceae bacterium]
MTRRYVAASLMLASLALGACRKKPVEVAPVPTTPSTAPTIDDAAARRAREDSLARLRADSIARAAGASDADAANLRTSLEAPVLFEYDASDVTEQGRATLDAKLPILRANTALRIRISGHTDSRGSDEYNLALGLRRAASARKYLSDRGIAVARIDVVSFGEERPSASGEDEGSFSKNRRAEFEILSGAESMRMPPR